MQDTAGEVGLFFTIVNCGPLHMDDQKQDDQLEPTSNSFVPTQDVALKTYQKQWTIERSGRRGSGISMLMARQDDDGVYVTVQHISSWHLSMPWYNWYIQSIA